MTARQRPQSPLSPSPSALAPTQAASRPVSKAEQTFKRLAATIEKKRVQLAQWQAFIPHIQQRVAQEIEPLQRQLHARQREMALLMDTLLAPDAPGRKLGRVQREKLEYLLLSLLDPLLAGTPEDAELVALHDKYSPQSHAQRQQEHATAAQTMLREMFGVDLGDDHDATHPEAVFAHAQRKFEAHLEAEAAQHAAAGPTVQSKKAAAAEAAREAAAQEVSQSLREVYRKLASALHPDREPDAGLRAEKTLLMQRVNQAYAARDLLGLLNLQWEVAQIGADHLASVPATRLAHYVQLLRDQLAGLEEELAMCTAPFQTGGVRGKLTTEHVGRQLDGDVAVLTVTLAGIEGDLEAFRDPVQLRRFLQDMRPVRDEEPDNVDELMMLMGMLDDLDEDPPRRSARRRR